jgi:hypothetical protein
MQAGAVLQQQMEVALRRAAVPDSRRQLVEAACRCGDWGGSALGALVVYGMCKNAAASVKEVSVPSHTSSFHQSL